MLKNRWLAFWRRIGAEGNQDDYYKKLAVLYSQPNRFYHTLAHIENCLDEFEQARDLFLHPAETEMALWYHDAVYDPKLKDNEERSAELSYRVSQEIGLSDLFGRKVSRLILATKHAVIPEDTDAQILVDIDLSIFGKSAEEFDEYERNIRREYCFVSDEEFRDGRSAVLQRFDDRLYIYITGFFRERYEARARDNLKRSLDSID